MGATRILRQDHERLRRKLALLESAIQVAPEARFVLREMCFSLQRLLQEHIAREADVLQQYRQRIPVSDSSEVPPSVTEHMDVYNHLRTVNELLLTGMRASMPTVIARLSHVTELLHEQMDDQESRAFPALDQVEEPVGVNRLTAISGTMSVNEILQLYPQTEQLFEQLHINRLQEGYKSVDEVAWYHGMDVSQLLEQLRQTATAFPDY